jgi:hypothetical protein
MLYWKKYKSTKVRKYNKTSDQSVNLLQILAAFLCGETQIVPEIQGISILFHSFMKIGQEKSLKNFIQHISMNDSSTKG